MNRFLWGQKHILDIENLSVNEIDTIFKTTDRFFVGFNKPLRTAKLLENKNVLLMFYENSTRTRCSFEIAAKNLGAQSINIEVATSAIKKGETLVDTIDNLVAMGVDAVVIRHSAPGICHQVERSLRHAISVINAGDGHHSHPTQALLDVYTMKQFLKTISDKKITIIGDILHSRVARSNIVLLKKLGADVHIVGPSTLMPCGIEKMGVIKHHNLAPAIENADVIMGLRIQLERQKQGIFPSLGEFTKLYGLNDEIIKRYAKPDVLIMHPGPMNRGVEIMSNVADSEQNSVILDQVTCGVGIRMALLYLTILCKGGINEFAA